MKKDFNLKILICLIAVAVFIPLIQMRLNIFPNVHLNGVQKLESKARLNGDTWLTGEFQSKFEKWFNQNYGLREYFIRTNNQIYFTLFNESGPSGEDIIIGKKGQLYGRLYIENYLQINKPININSLDSTVKELKELQNMLDKRGIKFIVLITPNKASIYPEFIPEYFNKNNQNGLNVNYKNFVSALAKNEINYVDGHQIMIDQKNSSNYPLFARGGLHWNKLGSLYATMQLLKKLELLTNKSLVQLSLSKVNVDYKPTGSDTDLAGLLNLWIKPLNYKAVHPIISNSANGTEYQPNILFEGGSFTYQVLEKLFENKVCSDLTYYNYYNYRLSYKDSISPPYEQLGKIDWDKDVFNRDVIVLEINELYITDNIKDLGSGFVLDLLSKLKDNNKETKH